MSFPQRRGVQLTLILLAAATLAACASTPKPMGPAPVASTPPAPRGAPGPGPVYQGSESGIPVPGSERDFVINAGDFVYFDFDRYAVRDEAHRTLDAQAAWLTRYPAVHVRIEGNCDERGTREYNFALGSRRANTVREYLVGRGISPSRIETISYGKEKPVSMDNADESQAKNRNAHTVITQGSR